MNELVGENSKKFLKMWKLLRKFLKTSKKGVISEVVQEEILGFSFTNEQKFFEKKKMQKEKPQENFSKKKPGKVLKKNSLLEILPFLLEKLEIKDLLHIMLLNHIFFSEITFYLRNSRLVYEESLLVQRVFALDSNKTGFSLQELKEFCIKQIPKEAFDFICLDYEEIQRKIQNFELKKLQILKKSQENPLNFDAVFRPFCRILVKKPEFIRNKEGISEENWFGTFIKLIKTFVSKQNTEFMSYFIDLLTEEQISGLLHAIKLGENTKKFAVLLEFYKVIISAYFCENPFEIRMKLQKNFIAKFAEKVNKDLKMLNFARKSIGIHEKMRIILDFSGYYHKKNAAFSQEILCKIYEFLGNKELFYMRILSKSNKIAFEKILQMRFLYVSRFFPQNFINIIEFLINSQNLLPKSLAEFNLIQKNSHLFGLFLEIFPHAKTLQKFQEKYDLSIKFRIFYRKTLFLSKLKAFSLSKSRTFGFELLIKALKLIFFKYKLEEKPEICELISLLQSFNGFSNEISEESIAEFLEKEEKPIIDKKSEKASKPVFLLKNSEFLIISSNLLDFLSLKEIYSWGFLCKICRFQAFTTLEAKVKKLEKQLKSEENQYKREIRSLILLRKMQKNEESNQIELIEDLSGLNTQEIHALKSLNKFPKKFEIFLTPFLALFHMKNQNFRSFQTFLKKKDLIFMINSLNIELISPEIINFIEKFLYDFRDFFQNTNKSEKKDTFEQMARWLKSLVSFYGSIRKYHVSYEDGLNLRFPNDHLKVYERLDGVNGEIFKYMKVCDIFRVSK